VALSDDAWAMKDPQLAADDRVNKTRDDERT
jgi:hypothetical protein